MAHNLATDKQGANMVYQGETPWHKLGTRIGADCTIEQALTMARMNYTVSAQPVFYQALGKLIKVDDAQLMIRDDNGAQLGTVGPEYHPIQHVEAFMSLAPMAKEFGMTVAAAGALGQGERLWMLLRLAQGDVTVLPGDDLRGYLLGTLGHDGKWAFDVNPTTVRVVCQNTLEMATNEAHTGTKLVKLYHTKQGAGRLDAAAALVKRVVQEMTDTGETFRTLAQRKMSADDVIRYVELLFPDGKGPKASDVMMQRRKRVADLVWTGQGSDVARSATNGEPNAWAAYNAVTEYFDHVRTAEGKSPSAREKANVSALWGSGADLKLAALKLAKQLVTA